MSYLALCAAPFDNNDNQLNTLDAPANRSENNISNVVGFPARCEARKNLKFLCKNLFPYFLGFLLDLYLFYFLF